MERSKRRSAGLSPALIVLFVFSVLSWTRAAQATTVDIMLVYDTTAASWVASNGGMTAFSQDVVNRMNQAMQNSGVDISFRLVHSMSVAYTTKANSSTPLSADLDALQSGAGAFAPVAAARDTYGADLVSMLVDHGSAYGYVGVGYILTDWSGHANYAHTVNAIRAVEIGHTLTHEVGHNFGADHAKSQSSAPGPNSYLDNQYSAGWYFTGTSGVDYHTIMAYNSDGYGGFYTEAPLFSTPLKTYQGTAAGHASHGDNARLLGQTKDVIAAYRSSTVTDPTDPTDPGTLEAPVALAATNVSSTGFTARWNGVSGAKGYWIEISDGPTFSSPYWLFDMDLGDVTSYAAFWGSPATTYYYRVFAHDDAGGAMGYSVRSEYSNTISVTTLGGGGVLENPRDFVAQQYLDFLGRQADSGGLDYWTQRLESGSVTRAEVVDSFFSSTEFQNGIAPLARLYFAYFDRIPDYDGLNHWIGRFKDGLALNDLSQIFAESDEFIDTYGALEDDRFVDLVYQNVLGRAPDSNGRAFWIQRLSSESESPMTRGEMMAAFSESSEYQSRSYPWVQVTMIYVGMLRRSPDQGGFDFWVAEIESGRSVLDLINGFLSSDEYAARF